MLKYLLVTLTAVEDNVSTLKGKDGVMYYGIVLGEEQVALAKEAVMWLIDNADLFTDADIRQAATLLPQFREMLDYPSKEKLSNIPGNEYIIHGNSPMIGAFIIAGGLYRQEVLSKLPMRDPRRTKESAALYSIMRELGDISQLDNTLMQAARVYYEDIMQHPGEIN